MVQAVLQFDDSTADRVEASLRDAEHALRNASPREEDRNTWGEIAALHAMVATLRGDATAAVAHVHEALECLDAANDTMRGVASSCLGAAYIGQGDLARAESTFTATVAAMRGSGNVALALAATEDLTYLQRARGKLDAAIASCERTLAWSAASATLAHPFSAAVHVSLADLRRERNELVLAAHHIDEAFACTTSWNLLISQMSSLFVRARLQGAQGETTAALATLEEVADLASRQPLSWIEPLLEAYRAQLWLAQGRLDAAADAVARASAMVAAPQTAFYAQFVIYGYEHLANAPIQLLIAQGGAMADPAPLQTALELAVQQQRRAKTDGLPWQHIKSMALQALAWQALGDGERAGARLELALTAAAPERYIRLFADEGAPMAALLTTLACKDGAGAASPGYIKAVLTACRRDGEG